MDSGDRTLSYERHRVVSDADQLHVRAYFGRGRIAAAQSNDERLSVVRGSVALL